MELNWNYAQAISDAGGVPILIPPTADMKVMANLIDGWLIPGGYDIHSQRFGQEGHPKNEYQDPARYECEEALWREISPEMPVLGICYGCQFLNVVRGGDLIQHVPDLVGHESHSGGTLQTYEVDPSSRLSNTVGTQVKGKSYHHQSVDQLGTGLKANAKSEDGLIEGIEATDRAWTIGVQWHPERTLEDSATQRLFQSFVDAARSYSERKR